MNLAFVGTQPDVHLPDERGPVVAELVEMPFRPWARPSARELARHKRRRRQAQEA